ELIETFLSPPTTSHAHPEPKRPAAAFANWALKASNDCHVELIASASLPFGAPPLPGPMIVQKNEWLLCPPALLRTGPRIASGTLLRSAISALTSRLASAGWSLSALFAFVT